MSRELAFICRGMLENANERVKAFSFSCFDLSAAVRYMSNTTICKIAADKRQARISFPEHLGRHCATEDFEGVRMRIKTRVFLGER